MKLLGIQGTGEDGMSLRFDCSYVHIEKNWKLTYPAGGCGLVPSPDSMLPCSDFLCEFIVYVIKSFAAYVANILWVYSYFSNQR